MPLSVNPKGHIAGDASDSLPKSRIWHPFSDKMIAARDDHDRERFNYRRERVAFDRNRRYLNRKKAEGRVFYG